MTLKQFKTFKLIMVFIMAFITSFSVVRGNYIIPLIVLTLSAIVLYYFRRRVKEVIADERDYQVGGKAAGTAIQLFSWIGLIAMLAFYSQKDANPVYEAIGFTLSMSICFLLIVYSLLFKYYYKK